MELSAEARGERREGGGGVSESVCVGVGGWVDGGGEVCHSSKRDKVKIQRTVLRLTSMDHVVSNTQTTIEAPHCCVF